MQEIKQTLMLPLWADSIGAVYCPDDGLIHSIGQARQAIDYQLIHSGWLFNQATLTITRQFSYTVPFAAESEMMVSCHIPGWLYAVGGTNNVQIIKYQVALGPDPSSWTLHNANMTAVFGARPMSCCAVNDGRMYIYGSRSLNSVISTADFVTIQTHANLPANLGVWGGGSAFKYGSNNILIGGACQIASPYENTQMAAAAVPGYVYRHNLVGDTYDLLNTDQVKHGTQWHDSIGDATTGKMYSIPGYVSATQAASYASPPITGNQRGLYKSVDGGVTWTSESLFNGLTTFPESHRRGTVIVPNTTNPSKPLMLVLCGNFLNDCCILNNEDL